MVEDYRLVEGLPDVAAYRRLRAEAGLSPKSEVQASRAMAGSWWGCHVVHEATQQVVAMGRLLGDGGWYFHVADMATLPAHQRQGLGELVLSRLMVQIRAEAPEGAFVSLMADPPGRRLYARHGFTEDRDATAGMFVVLDGVGQR